MSQHIFRGGLQQEPLKKRIGVLTEREHNILAAAAAGLGNEEISIIFKISPSTVRSRLYNTYKKINVPNQL